MKTAECMVMVGVLIVINRMDCAVLLCASSSGRTPPFS